MGGLFYVLFLKEKNRLPPANLRSSQRERCRLTQCRDAVFTAQYGYNVIIRKDDQWSPLQPKTDNRRELHEIFRTGWVVEDVDPYNRGLELSRYV